MKTLLKFGIGNAKLGKHIYTFSLPAGYSCPGASACLARADKASGKISDGKNAEFRCYAASMESRFPGLRAMVHHNFDLLRKSGNMAELILASIPRAATIVRIHVSGDFFSESYFKAWIQVAQSRPDILFYAYTKSINIWVVNRELIPANLRLTASRGGRFDYLIDQYGLKDVRVVMSLEEAVVLGLELDHDDTHAYASDKPFALLIHGQQAAGSKAAHYVKELNGVGSYSRK